MIRPSRLALAALAAVALPLLADEGMWMPQQIPALAPRLKEMGFTGDPNAFADLTGFPMGAIVSLGGCSASFVSPEGLIVTNHHCVVGSLQYNSTPQRNLIQEGFLARTKDEELSNGPGSSVYVTTSVKEVTDDILGKLDPKLADRQRYDAIERRVKERTAACEKDGARCRVASFFEGLRFFEIAQMEIKDVRLVYAPPSGIGVFGGETDNWQWPRHTGDWSYYRAYVSKDGKAAPYSKENVPYRPKHFLKVSTQGATPGDVVFVAGYPGRTQRLQTFGEIRHTVDWAYPRVVRRYADQLALLDEVSKGSKETEIKVASKKRGLNNTLTNIKGKLEGMLNGGLLKVKEQQEKELRAWIAADAKRQKEYGDVLPALDAVLAEELKTRDHDATLGALGSASSLLQAAATLNRLSLERPKKDIDREPALQERNWSRVKDMLERMQRSLDLKADRALLRYVMVEVAKLPAAQRIAVVDKAAGLTPGMTDGDAGKAIDAYLDRLYAGTKLNDQASRLALFEKTNAELVAVKDTFLDLAIALYPAQKELEEAEKARAGTRSRLNPRYMKAQLERGGGLVAPDANGTLRVTYGSVKGVVPRDGMIYTPQTTLAGIVEKHRGTGDFDAPIRELEAIKALRGGKKTPYADPKLGDVPVNFLSTVDTTGGNSGSATLNSKGELIGLLFDGTYDTVASDLIFDPVKTRSIHVDSRYMLWTMTEVDGAKNLLDEMGIKPGPEKLDVPPSR